MENFVQRLLVLPLLMLIAAPASALADGGTVIIPVGLILFVIVVMIRILARLSG